MLGSWPWLRFGHDEPWEADDSHYYGACLAAIAVGKAGEEYRANSNVEQKIRLLRSYLTREYSQQSLINRVTLLWASTELPGLMNPQQQKALVEEALSKQQTDGGWQLAPLVWKWRGWTLASLRGRLIFSDGSFAGGRSDGYATALMAFVLSAAGVSAQDTRLQKARSWLRRNQTEEGYWPSYSVNKRRNPTSNAGRFMSDAATAYAVLALTDSGLDNRRVAVRNDVHSATGKQLSY
jgi:squalene-hopene/tetraprenyl-beta-curcumene cyclase